MSELELARGANTALDAAIKINNLQKELNNPEDLEGRARMVTEMMAITWQGALLVQHAPAAVSDVFCASRLGNRWSGAYGALPPGVDLDAIIQRAQPV